MQLENLEEIRDYLESKYTDPGKHAGDHYEDLVELWKNIAGLAHYMLTCYMGSNIEEA
jgi:hypothetical protein